MRIAVPCPHCERDLIEDARELWFVQGLLVVTRYGSRRHIGCVRCVRGKVIANLLEVVVLGWWSMYGVLATPFVVLQNLFSLVTGPDEGTLRACLRGVGIDADEVAVDAFGRTREQDRVANAIMDVLAEAVWADGAASSAEIGGAAELATRLVGETFSVEEITGRLQQRSRAVIPESMRTNPDRVILLRAALAVVASDGVVAKPELGFIWDLAARLDIPRVLVERLLRDVGVSAGSAPPSAPAPQLARAASILDVPPTATQREAKAAHRRQAMRHHPDRAGSDQRAVQQANARMAELNWAYEQFAAQGAL